MSPAFSPRGGKEGGVRIGGWSEGEGEWSEGKKGGVRGKGVE